MDGRPSPWDGQLRNAPPLALLACWPLHGRTADLLRAVHVQASCLQLLAAWNRQTRAAEQLECCACRACRRGVKGGPPAAVELAERRSSACLGLGRAQCIALPRSSALDALIPPLRQVFACVEKRALLPEKTYAAARRARDSARSGGGPAKGRGC